MGKLANLWQELRETSKDSPRRKEIQEEINNIERWMISKKIKKDGITKWGDFSEVSIRYPWHVDTVYFDDIWMVDSLNRTGINYNSDKSIHVCSECNV